MVECELIYHKSIFSVDKSFNRYMVECEFRVYPLRVMFVNVLIDTWWNVNEEIKTDVKVDDVVLIDTWWNVNTGTRHLMSSADRRFNRYMVECE